MTLRIAVKTLALKLYVGYKRAEIWISKVIQINKELLFIEYGFNCNTMKVKVAERY